MFAKIINILLLLVFCSACIYISYFANYETFTINKWMLTSNALNYPSQYYRLATAHFAHFNLRHLIENLIALAAIWIIPRGTTAGSWIMKLIAFVMIGLAVSFGLIYCTNSLNSSIGYAGLSSILHGMLAFELIILYFENKSQLALIVFIGLILKITLEYFFPDLSFHELLTGLYGNTLNFGNHYNGTIPFKSSIEGHILGVIAGIVLSIVLYLYKLICRPKIIK